MRAGRSDRPHACPARMPVLFLASVSLACLDIVTAYSTPVRSTAPRHALPRSGDHLRRAVGVRCFLVPFMCALCCGYEQAVHTEAFEFRGRRHGYRAFEGEGECSPGSRRPQKYPSAQRSAVDKNVHIERF
ncbi:hypothetical protein B0H21DRAFT_728303 [Amylocystis lapponica]|nr:hypothetical protein B0H21DRAFT_728303 [Amylocystis lapponica]